MNIFYTACDYCNKEMQVHWSNYVTDKKRLCIPCKDLLEHCPKCGSETKLVFFAEDEKFCCTNHACFWQEGE